MIKDIDEWLKIKTKERSCMLYSHTFNALTCGNGFTRGIVYFQPSYPAPDSTFPYYFVGMPWLPNRHYKWVTIKKKSPA